MQLIVGNHPVLLIDQAAASQEDRYPASKVRNGHAGYRLLQQYEDPTSQYSAGLWEAGPCELSCHYREEEHELCFILAGEVRLVSEDGTEMMARAGDAFIVPGGWRGTWECLGRVRKFYAFAALK